MKTDDLEKKEFDITLPDNINLKALVNENEKGLSEDSEDIINTCIEKCRLYGNLLLNVCEDPNISQNALSDLGSEILFIASMLRNVLENEKVLDIPGY